MGFINDKNSISSSINQFEILGNLPKTRSTSSIKSVSSSSKNLLPFILDMVNQASKDHINRSGQSEKNKSNEVTRILIEILIKFSTIIN